MLKNDDKYSALLYSEYALELSNLDMYFKEKKNIRIFSIDYKMIYIFLAGVLTGTIISIKIRARKTTRKFHKS